MQLWCITNSGINVPWYIDTMCVAAANMVSTDLRVSFCMLAFSSCVHDRCRSVACGDLQYHESVEALSQECSARAAIVHPTEMFIYIQHMLD